MDDFILNLPFTKLSGTSTVIKDFKHGLVLFAKIETKLIHRCLFIIIFQKRERNRPNGTINIQKIIKIQFYGKINR